jgi:SecD/SecF fusion protein
MPAQPPANLMYLLFFGLSIAAIWGGIAAAKALRMKEYGWKLSLIFLTIVWAALVCRYKAPSLGIDLRGGDILIYEVDESKTKEAAVGEEQAQGDGPSINQPGSSSDVDMSALIQTLLNRINPDGMREVVVRQYGEKQVEIIIPEVEDTEIELIKQTVKETGFLKFRIVASKSRHPLAWELADRQLASTNELERESKLLKDGDTLVAEWVRLGREEDKTPGGPLPPYRIDEEFVKATMKWREIIPGEIEVLVMNDDTCNVMGSHLSSVNRGIDDMGDPRVDFQMTIEGAGLMGLLTGKNLPDDQLPKAQLGIVLDGQLLSAPGINSRIDYSGVIEGGFTDSEVEKLLRVLRAGKLPAVLFPEPISENKISPLLGIDTIKKGAVSILGSLAVVLAFMLWYYNFAGVVACLALILNLALTVSLMILLSASFTLPGIAGLVLTVGMSVDSNVLIFERIREELAKGSALRMAIRNGFERAMGTIVDSNVTTIIVAFVLYFIGTADIRGFGISLILGIITSMFTAIFCSRVMFDIAERRRWITTTLKMRQIIGETHFGFMGVRWHAIIASIVIILIGLAAVVMRGNTLLDIDFRGGTTVQVALKSPVPIDEMRRLLDGVSEDVTISEINPEGEADDTIYKIDTSLKDAAELREKVQAALVDSNGESLQRRRKIEFSPPGPYKETSQLQKRELSISGFRTIPVGFQEPATETPAASPTETDPVAEATNDQAPANPSPDLQTDLATPPTQESAPAADAATPTSQDATNAATQATYKSETVITFDQRISNGALTELIERTGADGGVAPRLKLSAEGWDGRSERGFKEWKVRSTLTPDEMAKLLGIVKSRVESQPVWLSSNTIGDKVAGDLQTTAIGATLLSLVLIVAYLWVRFHRPEYGIAAAVAVVHDVLVTLGFVALSQWLAGPLGFAQVEPFKISLSVVAAFLTLIGYSLNDTIVIFDRIREVKGKQPKVTPEIIDLSVNQTLSRTILTSLTVLMTVIVLYFFGGEGIHAFAFALLVGVIAGSYSTIFIASPVLLWLTEYVDNRNAVKGSLPSSAGRSPQRV